MQARASRRLATTQLMFMAGRSDGTEATLASCACRKAISNYVACAVPARIWSVPACTLRSAICANSPDHAHLQHVRPAGIAHRLSAGDRVRVTRLQHAEFDQLSLGLGERLV